MPLNSTPMVSAANTRSEHHAPLAPRDRMLPFVLITALFFLWAIPNNFNDILIRQFM